MQESTESKDLCDRITRLDARLDHLESQLRGNGGCRQAELLKETIEKSRQGLATRRLAVKETANANANESQKSDAMQAHDLMVLSYESQTDWLESAVASWRQSRERQGPNWQAELDKLREQCTAIEAHCDEVAAAVRSRGLRDGDGQAIANYAAQALAELFKLRVRMLEFAESPSVNSAQETERYLRIFAGELRQQEDHVSGFLQNRLSTWKRDTRS